MRDSLLRWVRDADVMDHIRRFGFPWTPGTLEYLRTGRQDYYISLVGELFSRLREPYTERDDWARLGNALTQADEFVGPDAPIQLTPDTGLFAAAAFYLGGFPASAYLTLRGTAPTEARGAELVCREMMERPIAMRSELVINLLGALREGDSDRILAISAGVRAEAARALEIGPVEWVAQTLCDRLIAQFLQTNLRAVLPRGFASEWSPLIRSFLDRRPPVWDFFPSQIEAINQGLLDRDLSFSLQMPTGAGKTALCETLLFSHLTQDLNNFAVLVVPLRSLAAELKGTLVKNMSQMGLPARCIYGGTVPTREESASAADTRLIVATPEALSGLLGSVPGLLGRVSLIICDEGHLLDGQGRGVALELLLARFLAQQRQPKFVFISAIVPNIEEINAWLGGDDSSVVRSTHRPAAADFARLLPEGSATRGTVSLQLHPHEPEALRFAIEGFLGRPDFLYLSATRRQKAFAFGSVKTLAIAAARKALPMGAVAVFAANKRGKQGALGLAEELLKQLRHPLKLPSPAGAIGDPAELSAAVEYFKLEYGPEWIGSRALEAGAILHHGDVPQESREVVERLIRRRVVNFAICTNTLAEGVNLPIRTLVLYSVSRRTREGQAQNLLSRDIKNLVGRAGRAGSTTRGLVICANANQWPAIEPVARGVATENVRGALAGLVRRLRLYLAQNSLTLTNQLLESFPELHPLVDGVDSTLIDLAAIEVGADRLRQLAEELSSQTYSARAGDAENSQVLRAVFSLRAAKISEIQDAGRLGWFRTTGARARLLLAVESQLRPALPQWDAVASPTDPVLIETLLTWAWDLQEVRRSAIEALRDVPNPRDVLSRLARAWIAGQSPYAIARALPLDLDHLLAVHARVVSFSLQDVVDQGVTLLGSLLTSQGRRLSENVVAFPDHLRFGVPTAAARILARGGLRHRRAVVALGTSPELLDLHAADVDLLFERGRNLINDPRWLPDLGRLIVEDTKQDFAQGDRT